MKYDTVTIPKNEYERLLERDEFLWRLEKAGVDNWPMYYMGFRDDDDPEWNML